MQAAGRAVDKKSQTITRTAVRRRAVRTGAIALTLMLTLLTALKATATTFTVINTNDSGAGSLRQAILDANGNNGADTIVFSIPGSGVQTIQPTSALPFITDAVTIDGSTQAGFVTGGAPQIVIDGTNAGSSNGLRAFATITIKALTIDNFSVNGIVITGGTGSVIQGCYIGLNAAGTAAASNGSTGIQINAGVANTTIGGAAAGEGNVISGNGSVGVGIFGTGANDNIVRGNVIGLNAAGTAALPNFNGIAVGSSASRTIIGGPAAGEGNVISGNSFGGISIDGINGALVNTVVQGNYIGTDRAGTAHLGNGGDAIFIANGANNTTIGGTGAGEGNIIAFTSQDGIVVGTAAGNSIRGNSIHDNGSLGIYLIGAAGDINGVNTNDNLDPDSGANGFQNYPVLSGVSSAGGTTTITGTLNSTANKSYAIDFYSNDTADASGYGEGQTYLGATGVTTDADGNATINVTLPVTVASNQFITATATRTSATDSTGALGDTSEFSADFALASCTAPPPDLVSWYPADNYGYPGVGKDIISGNHASLMNNATVATGKVGQAFSFDGTNQYVRIADDPTFHTANLTLEGWFKFTAPLSGTRVFLSKTVGNGTLDSYGLFYESGNLQAEICDLNGEGPRLAFPFTPTLNTWYHFAYTFDDNSNFQALYLNGAVVASGTVTKSIAYDAHAVLIGADNENGVEGAFPFSGLADEVSIYSRALSAAEIQAIVNADSGGKCLDEPYIYAPSSLAIAFAGQFYTQTINAVLGTAPYTFSLAAGTLPDGLFLGTSISNAGVLSGTPTQSGSFHIAVQVKDANNVTTQHSYTLLVEAPQIVYSRAPAAGNEGTIWIMNADGTGDHQVTTGEQPRLSPNGRYLVFKRYTGNADIAHRDVYVLDLQTGTESLFFANNDFVNSYDWTADSSAIAFDYATGLYEINRDGSNTHSLIPSPDGFDDAPALRRSDNAITFQNLNIGLLAADPGGSNRHQIPNTLPGDYAPNWSPDGNWIAFERPNTPDTTNLFKIHPDGTGLTQLSFLSSSDTINGYNPWTPDGSKVVVPGTINGVSSLYAVATDGSGIIERLTVSSGAAPDFTGTVTGNVSGTIVSGLSVVTNTHDSGLGSLRNALNYANNHPGTTITFAIPTNDSGFSGGVFTIKPLSELPTIVADGTTLDGSTQTAFTGDTNTLGPEVVLNGASAGNTASGLRLYASNCIINSLVINGFSFDGITINGQFSGDAITGCYLGTDAAGTTAVANADYGIVLFGGPQNNTIGGTTAAARNLISGNATSGIGIDGANTNGNVVSGNYIGLDRTGTTALPNAQNGVAIFGAASNNTIGGTTASMKNIISGNTQEGILISDSGTNGNVVQGNYLGTNVAGTAAIGNGACGVFIQAGAQNTIVGGTTAGARNLISGHASNAGVGMAGANTSNNIIQGNTIGTDAAGTAALPNLIGVQVFSSASNNTIGGTAAGAGNLISGNSRSGVSVFGTGGDPVGITIRGNAIFNNGGLGINLQPASEPSGTVTPNDTGDADSGPNNLQNYPVITNVTTFGSTTTVAGTLNSTANTTFILDLYRNSATDASGFGEGEVYAGSQDVTTDAAGNASFSFALTGTFTGQVFTVTATNKATGDTSEFAQDKGATAAALTLSVTPNLFSEGAGNNAAVGTVTRNTFTGVPLVVTLTSSTSRVKVPASITIPAGANSSTFSIDAVDNRAVDASQTVTITAGATGLPTATATLTVTDNDTPGITVTPTTGLVTTEAGGKASFQVVLNTQPTAAVSLGLSSSNTGEGTVAPATLTFTPQNWDQPQTVTVTGVDDTLADGNQPYTIVTAPATSTDPNYNKLDAADVSVINQDNESPTLTLSANPITIVEGASTTLTLTRNTPTGAALSVTLSSDNSGLPVPGSVTIPAGQASVTLSVTATDDTVVNGTRTATISASVSGFTGSNVAITITDNDVVTVPASLTVTLSPATVSEAAGVSASHGTVTRHDAPTTAPLSVQITTDQPGKARSAITTVIIPAGKTSTTFAIDAVDNNLVDGSQAVTFTATTDGFLPGTAILTVTDDDKPTLTLSITPTRLRETGGARAGQGTVSRNTATDKPLVVQLSSSNTTKLRVPPSVIIPAGANVATFAVTTINDNQPKGPRLVTIAARAPDFVSGTAQAIVTDAAPASNLSFGGQVTVVASSVAPGAPTGIGGATVTLLQKGIILDEVQTDASGHYQFTNLPVGSYTVTVQKDSYTSFSPASRTVEISPKGAPTHNDFVGTPQGSFSGRITQRLEDGTVQGVAGVTITAYSTGGVLTGRTGSTGQYTLTTAFVGPWLVVPVLRGTYFEPTTRVAALSPTTPVSTGLGFTATGTDVINPTVTILTPRPGSYKLSNQPTQATGTATDKGGAGMAVVTVALARFATATSKVPTGFWNWKANSFISTDNPLLVERLATGTTNWNLSGLPKLAAGFYGLRATALDGADNRIVSPFVRYSITGASAVAVEAGRAGASAIALSNASAQTATATIQLRFLGALEPESASDATHYTVTVNGRSVTVETAGYDVAHQTVTLSLPVGALQTGDTVAVQWSDLLDMQQQTLNGAVSLHAAP